MDMEQIGQQAEVGGSPAEVSESSKGTHVEVLDPTTAAVGPVAPAPVPSQEETVLIVLKACERVAFELTGDDDLGEAGRPLLSMVRIALHGRDHNTGFGPSAIHALLAEFDASEMFPHLPE